MSVNINFCSESVRSRARDEAVIITNVLTTKYKRLDETQYLQILDLIAAGAVIQTKQPDVRQPAYFLNESLWTKYSHTCEMTKCAVLHIEIPVRAPLQCPTTLYEWHACAMPTGTKTEKPLHEWDVIDTTPLPFPPRITNPHWQWMEPHCSSAETFVQKRAN